MYFISFPNEWPFQEYLFVLAFAAPHQRDGAVPAAQHARLRDHEETSTAGPKTKFGEMLTYFFRK